MWLIDLRKNGPSSNFHGDKLIFSLSWVVPSREQTHPPGPGKLIFKNAVVGDMIVEGGGYTIHLTQHHQRILCTPTKGNSPSPRLTVNGLRRIGSAMRSRPEKRKKKTASSSDASQALFAKHHLKCLRRFLVALSKSTEAWKHQIPWYHPLSQQSFWIFCVFNASSSCIQMELHHPPSQALLLFNSNSTAKIVHM